MKNIFSFFKKQKHIIEIAFYTDKVDYGTHGHIRAECRQRGINAPVDIRFCFVGLSRPPELTIAVMQNLFDQAANKGWVVHSLTSYGVTAKRSQPNRMGGIISNERRAAEDGSYKRSDVYGSVTKQPLPEAVHVARNPMSEPSALAHAYFEIPKNVQSPTLTEKE